MHHQKNIRNLRTLITQWLLTRHTQNLHSTVKNVMNDLATTPSVSAAVHHLITEDLQYGNS